MLLANLFGLGGMKQNQALPQTYPNIAFFSSRWQTGVSVSLAAVKRYLPGASQSCQVFDHVKAPHDGC